jgi:hypothetical protein
LDRWTANQGTTANGIQAQVTAGLTGFQNALKLGRNSGATTTGSLTTLNAFESINSIPLQGQVVTLSFWAKAGANYSGGVNGTGIDQSAPTVGSWTGTAQPITLNSYTPTTTWTRYTFTGTISSSATQICIYLGYTPTGTAGADDNLYITGVQLEQGAIATQFEARPYGTELALCQRYYEKTFAQSIAPVDNNANTWENALGCSVMGNINVCPVTMWQFKRTKRAIPTMVLYNPSTGTTGQFNDGSIVTGNALAYHVGTDRAVIANGGVLESSSAATSQFFIHATASAEL